MTVILKAWIFPLSLLQTMKTKVFGVSFYVSYPAVAFFTLALICDKKGTVIICFVSSLFHEIGHIIAMRLKGAKLKSVCFNLGDVAINADSSNLSYSAEFFVTLSGVVVNFLLCMLSLILFSVSKAEFFYNTCISNLLIGVFNLLPVRFLDGGQLVLLLLQKRFPPKICERTVDVLTIFFIVPIATMGLIFIFNSSYNYSLLFVALYLISTLVSKEYKNVS